MISRAAFLKRAKKIRLIATDVDGVLTEGSIVIFKNGEEIKLWSVRDRMGYAMLGKSPEPFYTAWITGRGSSQVEDRAREIGINALHQNCEDKGRALREVLAQFRLTPEEALFIGDDVVDLAAFKVAGLAVCPGDAHPAAAKACHWKTRALGGKGVLREIIDEVLSAQGFLPGILRAYEQPKHRLE